MDRDKQEEIELGWFHKCCEMNEKLFNYLSSKLTDLSPIKYYTISYHQYVKKTTYSNVNIQLKGIKSYNTSISLMSMLCETDKPFRLSLWKYNGEHTFKDYELEDIKETDFDTYLRYIKEFYGIKTKEISLFDFID